VLFLTLLLLALFHGFNFRSFHRGHVLVDEMLTSYILAVQSEKGKEADERVPLKMRQIGDELADLESANFCVRIYGIYKRMRISPENTSYFIM